MHAHTGQENRKGFHGWAAKAQLTITSLPITAREPMRA